MVNSHGEQDGFMWWRRSLVFLLSIVAVTMAIVMVVSVEDRGCSQRQSRSERQCITEVVRDHAFPADCMPAVRPVSAAVRRPPVPLPKESRAELRKSAPAGSGREQEARRLAVEKNQVMDALLNRPDIPSDYGRTMVALYRDRAQDVYTRDFAVQHIGLYAEALNRRGTYDSASRESAELRRALWATAGETSTIVAAAAFRALADLAAFDPRIDGVKLENRLAVCIGDANASEAARVMALQICGERRTISLRQTVRSILDDADSPAILRKAAEYAMRRLDGKEVAK